jgi:phospholipid/cholesterol/gamma-HCH transport system substrate-binding protein
MINKEDPRFRHLKKKIGLFALVALAVIVGVVVLIGVENDLFSPKYELKFTVDKGTGFTRGMSVKLSGFRIGRIKSISLNETAKVDIVLQIDKRYQKWIRKDSSAKLVKEGLVGDAIIEVSVGNPSLAMLEDQDVLAYTKTKALDELAEEIADKVKPVLSDVKDIIGYINDPNGDIKQTMKHFNLLSANLELTRQHADWVLLKAGNDMGTVTGKLNTVLDDTSLTVRRASSSMSKLDEKLPVILTSVEGSLKNVEQVSADLKSAEQQVLPRVPAMVKKTEDTLDDTNSVLHAVQGVWPISSHLPQPKEIQFVPGDSHD